MSFREDSGGCTGNQRWILAALVLLFTVVASPVRAYPQDFYVDGIYDAPDVVPGDGVCESIPQGNSACTLRAAVMEGNAQAALGHEVFIHLSPGETYELALDGNLNGGTDVGDLDITTGGLAYMQILGVPGQPAVIRAAGDFDDRLLDVKDNSLLVLRDIVLAGANFTAGDGGAIRCLWPGSTSLSVMLDHVTIRGNRALSSAAIRAQNCDVSLLHSAIEDNLSTANITGTAISVGGGDLLMVGSVVRNNAGLMASRTLDLFSGASAVIRSSTFSGNSRTAISARTGATLYLRNATITGNLDPSTTAAHPAVTSSATSTVHVFNSIIADNEGSDLLINGAWHTGYSLLGTVHPDSSPLGHVPINDPMLEPIGQLGPDAYQWGHKPLSNSPAIDAGNPSTLSDSDIVDASACSVLDQISAQRVGSCDVGAIELTTPSADVLPTAIADAITVLEDAPVTLISVLDNDTDPDGGPKTVIGLAQPANGTAFVLSNGDGVIYSPASNYCAAIADTFAYTLNGGSAATIAVTVTCVDDPPTAVADTASFTKSAGAMPVDVLANDLDFDGGPKAIAVVVQPEHGSVAIMDAGSLVTYTPDSGYCSDTESDDFSYTLNGGSSATVTINVPCDKPDLLYKNGFE